MGVVQGVKVVQDVQDEIFSKIINYLYYSLAFIQVTLGYPQ